MQQQGTTDIHPLRRWRARNDYTAYEVADLSGYSQGMISLIETWQRNPSQRVRVAIARALGVRVRDIFPVPEPPTDDEVNETLAQEGLR
jgi:transcriptional regulator with XRE-family HTH domain